MTLTLTLNALISSNGNAKFRNIFKICKKINIEYIFRCSDCVKYRYCLFNHFFNYLPKKSIISFQETFSLLVTDDYVYMFEDRSMHTLHTEMIILPKQIILTHEIAYWNMYCRAWQHLQDVRIDVLLLLLLV